jgi:protein TonB
MDANKILSADVLDIVFEGRNKSYGAYDLRKTYRQRLGKSILIMFSFLLLLVGANFLLGFISPTVRGIEVKDEVILSKVESPLPEKKVEPVIIKPAVPKGVKMPETFKMKAFTTPPIIEKNPPPDQMPPEMADLDKDVKIGTANINDGNDFDGTVTAPQGEDKGILNGQKKTDGGDNIFIPIEKESEYPGGPKAWTKFLERNLSNNLPQEAVDNGIEGTVMLRFVVDVDGAISDITVVSGPKEYQDAAIKAIRKSGKWEPALQNGHKVKSYKMQAITVRLQQ